ncbi:hypothetical protein AB670_02747 [Chryseobacterium sp. MOF25P]|uniref:hypothetical protein n=1 Tax=unclassified Chryseobacterium TaxID=2593645 RepID=UPI00080598C4|nr:MULTISPECIES: hypothetical protein [unclassified Chryseobacterium]OBW40796.1 hypothetical protein AB670_02747 [Chryseobacterium sp. MOF25P]OBW45260.1 hypothetical protein AB671_02557 [Chryseobacterium sp. BGARF1]
MKLNIEFLQTGGVPLTNNLMAQIVDSIKLYDAIGDLAGHMTIISGCDFVSGSTTTVNSGVVAINGEILVFEGGLIDTNVFIHESQVYKTFQDQTSKVLVKIKTVKFGNAVAPNLFPWTEFVKLQTIKSLQASLAGKADKITLEALEKRVKKVEFKTAPIENGGVAFIFRKPASEIPLGWKECTDLSGKTVFGYNQFDPDFSSFGLSFGSKTVTLSKNNLPKFKVRTSILQPYGGNQGLGGFDGGGNQWNWKNIESEQVGNDEAFKILPPYEIVIFIEPNFQ